jgi:hypothetical protein
VSESTRQVESTLGIHGSEGKNLYLSIYTQSSKAIDISPNFADPNLRLSSFSNKIDDIGIKATIASTTACILTSSTRLALYLFASRMAGAAAIIGTYSI